MRPAPENVLIFLVILSAITSAICIGVAKLWKAVTLARQIRRVTEYESRSELLQALAEIPVDSPACTLGFWKMISTAIRSSDLQDAYNFQKGILVNHSPTGMYSYWIDHWDQLTEREIANAGELRQDLTDALWRARVGNKAILPAMELALTLSSNIEEWCEIAKLARWHGFESVRYGAIMKVIEASVDSQGTRRMIMDELLRDWPEDPTLWVRLAEVETITEYLQEIMSKTDLSKPWKIAVDKLAAMKSPVLESLGSYVAS